MHASLKRIILWNCGAVLVAVEFLFDGLKLIIKLLCSAFAECRRISPVSKEWSKKVQVALSDHPVIRHIS